MDVLHFFIANHNFKSIEIVNIEIESNENFVSVSNLKVKLMFFIWKSPRSIFQMENRAEAKNYGVTGWVRNLSDGMVEAVFAGEKEDVDRLINFSRKGPSWAKFLDLNVKWEQYV